LENGVNKLVGEFTFVKEDERVYGRVGREVSVSEGELEEEKSGETLSLCPPEAVVEGVTSCERQGETQGGDDGEIDAVGETELVPAPTRIKSGV